MATIGLRKLTAVLIDDDPSVVRIAKAMLANVMRERLEIVSFTDPLQARHWMEANRCDLLISDMELPGVDGLEMLRFAKQRNAWTQVIFMTAQSSWSRVPQALELGASNYVLKPLNREEILAVVEQEYTRCARWLNSVRGTLVRQVEQPV